MDRQPMASRSHNPSPDERPLIVRHGPAVALSVLYGVLVLPMILSGAGYGPPAWDEETFHLPIVQKMVEQWPRVDVVEYDSATTPGYHLLMALVLKLTGSLTACRLVSAAMSWGLLMAAYAAARRVLAPRAPVSGGRAVMHSGWIAAVLVLPLALSQYFLGAAIWLTTDNAALLFVALALGGAVTARFTPGRGVLLGVWALVAVLVRQLHVWVAAPIGLAALLASPLARFAPAVLRDDERQSPRRWENLVCGVIAAALPAAALAVFIVLWGALLPRSEAIRGQHLRGMNPATFAFALSLLGVLGVFFLTVAPGGVVGQMRRLHARWGTVAMSAGAGLVSALAFPTFWVDRVRDTGLWALVKAGPVVMERSVVLAALAPMGAVVLLLLFRAANEAGRRAPALVLMLGMLAWVTAQSANIMCWHRYFEPLMLVCLAWLAAMGVRERVRAAHLVGPAALALLLGAVSAWLVFRPAVTGG